MVETDAKRVTSKDIAFRLGTQFTDSYLTDGIRWYFDHDPESKSYWQNVYYNRVDGLKNFIKFSELKKPFALREIYKHFVEEVDGRGHMNNIPLGFYEGRLAARTIYGFVLPVTEAGFDIENIDRTNVIDDIAQGLSHTPIRPSSFIKLLHPAYDVAQQKKQIVKILDKITDEVFAARRKIDPSPDLTEDQFEEDQRVVEFLNGPTIYAD